MTKCNDLKETYYNTKTGYSRMKKLQRKMKNHKKKLLNFYTNKILIQNTNQLKRIFVHYPDEQWQADLTFMVRK